MSGSFILFFDCLCDWKEFFLFTDGIIRSVDVGKYATSRIQIKKDCVLNIGSVDAERMQQGWTEKGCMQVGWMLQACNI